MNRKPRLRPDVAIVEQLYRGEVSYVVKDLETHKYFRFRPVEVTVMRSLDGTRTCGEAAAALRDAGIGVSEAVVEGFAQKLGRMGLIERSLTERSTLQVERLRAERNRRSRPQLFRGELMRMRWSMGDPDAAFDRWMPRISFLFTRPFLLFSAALFVLNAGMLAWNWREFQAGFAHLTNFGSYSLAQAVISWLTLLVVILIHELGHGLTCKHFGGEVHEMGFMLIYFQPAFYANVNDAWTFPDLRARLWVTAAGSWIEGVVATLAGIVWWFSEPGTMLAQVSLLVFLFGGIFSVMTNANPLLPLDGYFALSDYLEIPNLRHRAFSHIDWIIRRYVLRLDMPMPPASEREQRVFVLYGLAAIAYISMVLSVAAGFILGWAGRAFGPTGTAVGIGLILLLFRGQLRSWGAALALSLREHRATLLSRPFRLRAGGALAALLLVLLLVPWSITVSGPFSAAPAHELALVAPDSGYVAGVFAREGASVPAGASLIRLRDFDLERAALEGRRAVDSLAMLAVRVRAEGRTGEVERIAAQRAAADARLASATERIAALSLRARHAGVVLTPRPERLAGRWVMPGETVLTLGDPDSVEVRIRLRGGGATLVKAGQPVRMLSLADVANPRGGTIVSVSRVAGAGDDVEARLRLPAHPAWRPGSSGEASIVVRKSNIIGALWWGVRKRVRSDLLL